MISMSDFKIEGELASAVTEAWPGKAIKAVRKDGLTVFIDGDPVLDQIRKFERNPARVIVAVALRRFQQIAWNYARTYAPHHEEEVCRFAGIISAVEPLIAHSTHLDKLEDVLQIPDTLVVDEGDQQQEPGASSTASNTQRASRIADMLEWYKSRKVGDSGEVMPEDIIDLLTDLRHFIYGCDSDEMNFDSMCAISERHFEVESNDWIGERE